MVREVQDVALGGELGGPDHVPHDNVHGDLPRLKLGLYLLEVIVARGSCRPPHNLDLTFVFLVEPVDSPLQAPRRVGPESEGDPNRTAPFTSAAASGTEHRHPRKRGTPQPEKPLPTHPAPTGHGPSHLRHSAPLRRPQPATIDQNAPPRKGDASRRAADFLWRKRRGEKARALARVLPKMSPSAC